MTRGTITTRFVWLYAPLVAASLTIAAGATLVARTPAPRSPVHGPAVAAFDGIGTLNPAVLDLALGAATCAVRAGIVDAPSTLTVIDYSKPSTAKRFWLFDLRAHHLLYEALVSHGQGSGGNLATLFSNEPETHRSSLGLFVTEDTYIGKNGYSLRLNGLDVGFNDRARERAIVIHGAPYVSEAVALKQGRLGRSWGCPALDAHIARPVIDSMKGGGLLFAYYPDGEWLRASKYLGGCGAAN